MQCTSTIVIQRPVDVVWNFFDTPDNMKLWLTGFVRFEHLTGIPGTVGATSRHVYEMNGKPFELIEEITVKEHHKAFHGILRNKMMISTIRTIFTDLGNGTTELMSTSDVTFQGLMKLVAPFMKNGFQRRQDADLKKLKMSIEAQ